MPANKSKAVPFMAVEAGRRLWACLTSADTIAATAVRTPIVT